MSHQIDNIKKRSEFVAISNNNVSYYSKSTLILAQKTPEQYIDKNSNVRVGYTVTKKIGNAVFRNKCKRRYREAFRFYVDEFAIKNYDYVILARKEIINADFRKIKSDVKFCLKGIKRLIENEQSK